MEVIRVCSCVLVQVCCSDEFVYSREDISGLDRSNARDSKVNITFPPFHFSLFLSLVLSSPCFSAVHSSCFPPSPSFPPVPLVFIFLTSLSPPPFLCSSTFHSPCFLPNPPFSPFICSSSYPIHLLHSLLIFHSCIFFPHPTHRS